VPGDREQQDSGQELRQSNVSEVERAFRDLIDLPSNGHGLHLDRRYDQKAGNLEENKSRMGKGDASRPGIGRRRHELLM
jgi:hypothetical protein